VIVTSQQWDRLGYRDRAPAEGFEAWLGTLPTHTVTWFARGDYDRALVTVRDRQRVLSLPVVNGGTGQHANTPYFPIPFSPGLVAGVADESFPQLVPELALADGTRLMPLAYARDLTVRREGEALVVRWRQAELDRLGGRAPVRDARVSAETTYRFEPGRITRTDRFSPAPGLGPIDVSLVFASFSEGASMAGPAATFARGAAARFSVRGLPECAAVAVDDARYRSPGGPMRTLVSCRAERAAADQPVAVSWTLEYR
jgi:hypothetical protein